MSKVIKTAYIRYGCFALIPLTLLGLSYDSWGYGDSGKGLLALSIIVSANILVGIWNKFVSGCFSLLVSSYLGFICKLAEMSNGGGDDAELAASVVLFYVGVWLIFSHAASHLENRLQPYRIAIFLSAMAAIVLTSMNDNSIFAVMLVVIGLALVRFLYMDALLCAMLIIVYFYRKRLSIYKIAVLLWSIALATLLWFPCMRVINAASPMVFDHAGRLLCIWPDIYPSPQWDYVCNGIVRPGG